MAAFNFAKFLYRMPFSILSQRPPASEGNCVMACG